VEHGGADRSGQGISLASVTPMHVLGKALTGGYLPLAITLVAEAIFLEFSNI
jgi:adenosylmethionine-8-amino-7-oxononanoate aminotransferase